MHWGHEHTLNQILTESGYSFKVSIYIILVQFGKMGLIFARGIPLFSLKNPLFSSMG